MDYLVYKKGLDEREIFEDRADFELWEKLLSGYLVPYETETTIYKGLRPYRQRHKQAMNMYGKIELLAYCLMPTHIYMVVRELEKGAVTSLMRKISTFYSMYYNQKHKRSGYVFEGSFKCQEVKDVENTIRLVHQLPAAKTVKRFGMVQTTSGISASDYLYSSLKDYLGERERKWVTPVGNAVKGTGEGKLPW